VGRVRPGRRRFHRGGVKRRAREGAEGAEARSGPAGGQGAEVVKSQFFTPSTFVVES